MKLLPSFEDPDVIRIDRLTSEHVAGEKLPEYDAIAAAIAPGKTIFFIGIAGISVSGLAEYASRQGIRCAGSDPSENTRTAYLQKKGILVFHKHDASNIDQIKPDLVVYSNAVSADNPERVRAAKLDIPCVNRSVFLGTIGRMFRRAIHITGTNGKTTTTAMCALMLLEAKLDPMVHLGAEFREFRSTIRFSESDNQELFLSEACEYQRGFYHYEGTAIAILNIVHDHIDSFPTIDDMIDAFARFAALQPENTYVLVPSDDPHIPAMMRRLEEVRPGHSKKLYWLWFGPEGAKKTCGAPADFTYRITSYDDSGHPSFQLYKNGSLFTSAKLSVIGEFNVKNAVAAAALADLAGATPDNIRIACEKFQGAEGRFTHTGRFNGADIYVDYAHHPSAVEVTVKAIKNMPAKRFWICFQPMTYSRTLGFFDAFVESLYKIRPVLISEVFDNREKNATVSSKDMCDRINELGGDARYFETNEALEAYLRRVIEPDDVVLIMGGGTNILEVGDRLTGRSDHMAPVL